MPTLTYSVKVGTAAGVSQGYKNPSLRLSEIDPNRTRFLETYTVPGSVSKFGWESELISFDDFGKLTSGPLSFIGSKGSVSAVSGYAFVPTEKKIKLKTFVSASAVIYKRGEFDSIYIKFGEQKSDKYFIYTSRVGELDRIEEDSHSHGINLDEVGSLAIELSHVSIPEEKTKHSSEKVIALDFYPVANVRVEGSSQYTVDTYSGIVRNDSGAELTIKYNPAPLVIVHNGPAVYTKSVDPSVSLNLLEIKNPNPNKVTSSQNRISSDVSFFIEPTGRVELNGQVYTQGRKHILPPGDYELSAPSSEWATAANQKAAAKDISVIQDIKDRLLRRYSLNGANPISSESVANGDVYKVKEDKNSGSNTLEVVVDNEDRSVILPHLASPSSVTAVKVGHRNSRTEVQNLEKDNLAVLKFPTKGRYIIKYFPVKETEWDDSNSAIIASAISELSATQSEIKVYYGTEENGSVEYLNIDNPIIIGSNNG